MSDWESGVGKLSLADQTNKPRDPTDSEANSRNGATEGKAGAWVERTGYNYDMYNASTREEREAMEKEVYTEDIAIWAASAQKYEWKDEYGDVGPAYPELEKQLFNHDFINRQGKAMAK